MLRDVFVHENAVCESSTVGEGTRIWAFAHILPGARIGKGCNVCDGVFVENDVSVGDNVTVKCGVQLWDGLSLEDDVFVGPNATFANDRFPRSKVYPETYQKTIIRKGASIGANATILPGVEIGPGAMIGAGAVVTRNVPPNAIVVGNPGRITGYVQTSAGTAEPASIVSADHIRSSDFQSLGVGSATLHQFKVVTDMRGSLTAGEFEREIPFVPRRYFVVFDVPTREVRGEHAHKQCDQFFVCLKGSVGVLLDDGSSRRELTLNNPGTGVFMPAMIWGTQYRYSSDAVLLVFASQFYDANDYIRTYAEFRANVGDANKG
jgi:UDP-2-acetamido-3-amino-2,3-dideoxy-glucuronate N-acetyltransferase